MAASSASGVQVTGADHRPGKLSGNTTSWPPSAAAAATYFSADSRLSWRAPRQKWRKGCPINNPIVLFCWPPSRRVSRPTGLFDDLEPAPGVHCEDRGHDDDGA